MPPMKQMTPPVSAGGATAPAAVAGAAGGGDTAAPTTAAAPAAAVGIGSLTGLLAQLTEAISLLGKAIAGMTGGRPVGGGGPIQVPPGTTPIQGGGGSLQPVLAARIDKLITAAPTDAAKVKFIALARELAKSDERARVDGTQNPATISRIAMEVDLAVLPAGDARTAELTKLVGEAKAFEAQSDSEGSTNMILLQRLSQAHQAVLARGPALAG